MKKIAAATGALLLALVGLTACSTEPEPTALPEGTYTAITAPSGTARLSTTTGTPVTAVEAGTVEKAGATSGMNTWVVVKDQRGDSIVYGNLGDITVTEGQKVKAGQQIGVAGQPSDLGVSRKPTTVLVQVWEGGRFDGGAQSKTPADHITL